MSALSGSRLRSRARRIARSIAHGIANQATTVMIRARAAITMIAHSVTQIANGTRRFRCMFGQIKRREFFYTIQKTSRAREPTCRSDDDTDLPQDRRTLRN
jgi:hypothetical protein